MTANLPEYSFGSPSSVYNVQPIQLMLARLSYNRKNDKVKEIEKVEQGK